MPMVVPLECLRVGRAMFNDANLHDGQMLVKELLRPVLSIASAPIDNAIRTD